MGNIVLVGAGGTGMSGVAGLLHNLGYTNIICIDEIQSELTDKLKNKGIKIIIGHQQYEPTLEDVIIYSEAAIDTPEIKKARELAKTTKKAMPILNYFQFLGEISKYFISVGFAGTNGKSSTAAMAITTAKGGLKNFGIGILGALVPQLDNQSYYINPQHKEEIKSIFDRILKGSKQGNMQKLPHDMFKKFYFFVEACEYKRHFLYLDLDYSVITSIELDHTDYYKDMDDYLSAFQTLIEKTKQNVFIPENIKLKLQNSESKIIPVKIQNIDFDNLRGVHNDINGSLSLELLNKLSISTSHIINLQKFQGLRRRMELLGKNSNGALIYSDYGHMSSSIQSGYESLKKKYPNHKLQIIFQPHQINRILRERDEFILACKQYDNTIIYDIYAARENLQELLKKFKSLKIGNHESITIADLGELFAQSCGGSYTTNINDIEEHINKADENTIIVIFSAGNIDYKIRKIYSKSN